MEWQHLGDDDWVYGEMIRGVVRNRKAEVHYYGPDVDPKLPWGWIVWEPHQRGRSANLGSAVGACESVIDGKPIDSQQATVIVPKKRMSDESVLSTVLIVLFAVVLTVGLVALMILSPQFNP